MYENWSGVKPPVKEVELPPKSIWIAKSDSCDI
jgi:hypothetical protein